MGVRPPGAGLRRRHRPDARWLRQRQLHRLLGRLRRVLLLRSALTPHTHLERRCTWSRASGFGSSEPFRADWAVNRARLTLAGRPAPKLLRVLRVIAVLPPRFV